MLASADQIGTRRSLCALLAINVPLVVVCVVHAWNVASAAVFWPVLLLFVALFAVGCYSFLRLIPAAT